MVVFSNTVAVFLLLILFSTVFIFIHDLGNFLKGRPPFLPSSKWEVDRILSIYDFDENDMVVDLGSGDARILIRLAERGISSTGFETNPLLVAWSKIAVAIKGYKNKVEIKRGNFLKENLSNYNVFIIYGIKQMMPKIEKKLIKESKKGSVVISNKFKLPNMKPVKTLSTTYLYKI